MGSWNIKNRITLPILFLALLPQANANEPNGKEKFQLPIFRANQISVFQGGGNSFSGELSWNPIYHFSPTLGIVGNLGISLLNATGSGAFVMTEYEALFSFDLDPIWNFEIGGGAQTWFTSPSSSTSPVLSLNPSYRLTEKLWGIIDRVFLGYSAVFLTGVTAHEIKVGVQFSF